MDQIHEIYIEYWKHMHTCFSSLHAVILRLMYVTQLIRSINELNLLNLRLCGQFHVEIELIKTSMFVACARIASHTSDNAYPAILFLNDLVGIIAASSQIRLFVWKSIVKRV